MFPNCFEQVNNTTRLSIIIFLNYLIISYTNEKHSQHIQNIQIFLNCFFFSFQNNCCSFRSQLVFVSCTCYKQQLCFLYFFRHAVFSVNACQKLIKRILNVESIFHAIKRLFKFSLYLSLSRWRQPQLATSCCRFTCSPMVFNNFWFVSQGYLMFFFIDKFCFASAFAR